MFAKYKKTFVVAIIVAISFVSHIFPSYAENPANSQSAAAATPAADKPIMVIRFNQKYVYFQNPLKNVVDEVRKVQPDAMYEVQSIVPAKFQEWENEREQKASAAHLSSVVAELGKLGVLSDRIKYSSAYSNEVANQEIKIFVK